MYFAAPWYKRGAGDTIFSCKRADDVETGMVDQDMSYGRRVEGRKGVPFQRSVIETAMGGGRREKGDGKSHCSLHLLFYSLQDNTNITKLLQYGRICHLPGRWRRRIRCGAG